MEKNYGGFGYTTLQDRENGQLIANYGYIDHLTNIDYCELAAINACLQETINDMSIMNDIDYNYITILTDSMFCVY